MSNRSGQVAMEHNSKLSMGEVLLSDSYPLLSVTKLRKVFGVFNFICKFGSLISFTFFKNLFSLQS
jgi:hypothetical protein